jgi:hypothetical protein
MRRTLVLLALLAMAGTALPVGADDLAFQYTIQRERDGSVVDDTFLKGFEVTDGLRLRVKLNQTSYCYVIMSAPAGGYRLVFPNPGTLKGGALPLNEWARIPRSTFLRLGEDPGAKRMYIIVSARRVPELDDAAAKGDLLLTEAKTLEVRDRYAHADAGYTKQLEGQTFSIKYRAKAGEATSVVEEIALLPGDAAKRADPK